MDETIPLSHRAAFATEARMTASIAYPELASALGSAQPPLLIDVRRRAAFTAARDMARGALRRDPDSVAKWSQSLPAAHSIVVYCVHGHEVSQSVAAALCEAGMNARYLEGGLEEGWRAHGALDAKPTDASTRWITRERPKIDRIACPWLVSRFVDADAEFLYVPAGEVRKVAATAEAVPYDVPDVAFSHEAALCSFDAFLRHYRLSDPALARLAVIVRGADTDRLELAREAAGLLAISLGLSRICSDDLEMLKHGMVLYDALYAWCRDAQDEVHTWNPAAYA